MIEADGKFYFSASRLNCVEPLDGSIGSKVARCRRTGTTESLQWTRSLQANLILPAALGVAKETTLSFQPANQTRSKRRDL
jgi:hypothetical protein